MVILSLQDNDAAIEWVDDIPLGLEKGTVACFVLSVYRELREGLAHLAVFERHCLSKIQATLK